MGASEVDTSEKEAAGRVSGDVVGGLLTVILGLVHLYGLQLGGIVGFVVLLVVWPLIGGAVGAWYEASRDGRGWQTTSVLSGVFGAIVVSVVVLLTGVMGAWSRFITAWFGVTLWPVVISVAMELIISWAVFGYTGGFIVSLVTGSAEESDETSDETEEHDDETEEPTEEPEESDERTEEPTEEPEEIDEGAGETEETTGGIEATAGDTEETSSGTGETA